MQKYNFDHINMLEVQQDHPRINHLFECSMNSAFKNWQDILSHEQLKHIFVLWFEGLCYGISGLENAFTGKINGEQFASDVKKSTAYVYFKKVNETPFPKYNPRDYSKEMDSLLKSIKDFISKQQ